MDINKKYEFANFGIRLGALLIDAFVMMFLIIALMPFIMRTLRTIKPITFEGFLFTALLFLIGIPLIGLIYRSIFESSIFQGTPGKIITGIKVVNHNFARVTFLQAVLRNFVKIFSSMFFYIGFLVALGNYRCITWHDQLAKTYVIKEIKFFMPYRNIPS